MILILFLVIKNNKKNLSDKILEEEVYSTNIIKDVNYTSRDAKGNVYTIDAKEGEIDLSNSSVIFLTNVRANIKLTNKDIINITSKYGKYNIDNYDTIFTKNVLVIYLDNKIKSEYLDFSLGRNSMIISNNVVYTNKENILKADVIDMNIETKDTKIFMYDKEKKINIKSIN